MIYMTKKIFEAKAPARIDLAGGTLDIWPLYVLEEYGLTVNAAIDLHAKAVLTKRDDKKINIISKDLGKTVSANSLDELRVDDLELYCRIAKFFKPDFGFDIILSSSIPAGSGIGGSSSLAIAVAGLLNKLTGKNLDSEQLIWLVGNLEAKTIMINTGKQDYYAALHGGINSIWFHPHGNEVERHKLSEGFMKKLSEQMILCYVGESRFSGTNNWNMLKRYIDNVSDTRKAMRQIKKVAHDVHNALKNEDLNALTSAINEEWSNRKMLAEGVTTKRIEHLINVAKKNGAMAAKICGAGGGGCMILVCKEGAREDVKRALESDGARILDFSFDHQGFQVLE